MSRFLVLLLASMNVALCFVISSDVKGQSSTIPETFLIDGSFLKSSKDKIEKGDPILADAKKALIKAADDACKNGPYTVTSKAKLPPSGDKHDYMSVGPYWWPDSTKADGLPYIRKDGRTNPERHSIKDSDYLKSLSRDVKLLGLAYYFTGDKKYSDHAAYLLKVWFLNKETKMNPHLKYGQSIPGITEGRGIGIIDTKCMVDLIDGTQLIKGSVSWKPNDHRALQQWFTEYLKWLMQSDIGKDEADEHNNHGVYYDVQTSAYALFTGDKALAKDIIEKNTLARIESQISEDGSQPYELARTKSLGYTFMNLKGFFALARIGETVGLDLWNYNSPKGRSIRKAFLWMLPYASGDEPWEHEQIEDFKWSNFLPLIRMATGHYKDIDLKSVQQKLEVNSEDMYLSQLANTVLY